MERLLRTLADAGVPVRDRVGAADTVLSHVTGFVLQEQAESLAPQVGAEEDEDQVFSRSVRLLCRGIATLIES